MKSLLLKRLVLGLCVLPAALLMRPTVVEAVPIIGGNGQVITDLAPIDAPDQADLDTFLTKLSTPEGTWVRILRQAFVGERPLIFMKTDESCFLQTSPKDEVTAFFNHDSEMIIFCKKYFELSDSERIVTWLHELTHYGLYYTRTNLGDGEEAAVQLAEYYYRKAVTAAEFGAFKTGVLGVRSTLDRYVPNLIVYSSAATELGATKRIRILNSLDSRVSYPVPAEFGQAEYIPSHFLEYRLNEFWTKDASFHATELPSVRDSYDFYPEGDAVFSLRFPYVENTNGQLGVRMIYPANAIYSGHYEIAPSLLPRQFKADFLTSEFRQFLESLSGHYIRTIGVKDQDRNYRDNIYFFQK